MKKAIIISVLEQIEKNLEERIDIEKLVVITGYSRRSLQDFFKEKCGVSIGKYIRQRKLSRSATLLKLTSQSVTDIAFRMGFDSVQSYSREFKKTFGVLLHPCTVMTSYHPRISSEKSSLFRTVIKLSVLILVK